MRDVLSPLKAAMRLSFSDSLRSFSPEVASDMRIRLSLDH